MKTYLINNNLMLPTDKGVRFIEIGSIVRVQAISNYSKIFFDDGSSLVVAKVLRWFEEILGDSFFLRTHRSHIVNRKFILHYSFEEGGTIQLYSGECIAVSKRKKSFFLKSLYEAA